MQRAFGTDTFEKIERLSRQSLVRRYIQYLKIKNCKMKKVLSLTSIVILSFNSLAQPFLSGPHEFYLSTSYNSNLAGIRNNSGHPVLNSKEGGTLYLNRDVSGTTKIQSKISGTSFTIASFMPTGMVGIGTDLPDSKLAVNVTSNLNSTKILSFQEHGNSQIWLESQFEYTDGANAIRLGSLLDPSIMTWRRNGNVGIGTSSPDSKLHIEADSWQLRLKSLNNESDWRIGSSGSGWIVGAGKFLITNTGSSGDASIVIDNQRRVGIGTTNPQSRLAVNGQIRATEVKVLADISVPDYVFEPDYELRTLKETKKYIAENKHLPEIPSATEIGENGIDLGDMNMRLLKKIEELTLYQIELLERIEELEKRVDND